MRGPGLQRGVSVGNGTAGIIMAVKFDIRLYLAAQYVYQFVNLVRRADTHRVGDANAVQAQLIHGFKDVDDIFKVAAQAIFRTEADFYTLAEQ